jgi:malonyl-CoA O-methyltransferase
MTTPENAIPRQSEVRRRFDRLAATPDAADFAFQAGRDGILERLLPIRIEARTVLLLGAGSGGFTKALGERFAGSRILNLDLSHAMLCKARRRRWRFSRDNELQANAEAIPLAAGSVDAVVSNLLLPWIADPPQLFREVARVLKTDGLFAFSALGPDSLNELRCAFDDDTPHVRQFADMHDIGDALVKSGLRDPVLDIDHLAVNYKDTHNCFRDLTLAGARNTLAGRRPTLTGKDRWQRLTEALRAGSGGSSFRVSLELVYGHAWGGTPRSADGEFRFRVDDLRGRRR